MNAGRAVGSPSSRLSPQSSGTLDGPEPPGASTSLPNSTLGDPGAPGPSLRWCPEPRGVAELWPVLHVTGKHVFRFFTLINLNRHTWLPQRTIVDGGAEAPGPR